MLVSIGFQIVSVIVAREMLAFTTISQRVRSTHTESSYPNNKGSSYQGSHTLLYISVPSTLWVLRGLSWEAQNKEPPE